MGLVSEEVIGCSGLDNKLLPGHEDEWRENFLKGEGLFSVKEREVMLVCLTAFCLIPHRGQPQYITQSIEPYRSWHILTKPYYSKNTLHHLQVEAVIGQALLELVPVSFGNRLAPGIEPSLHDLIVYLCLVRKQTLAQAFANRTGGTS